MVGQRHFLPYFSVLHLWSRGGSGGRRRWGGMNEGDQKVQSSSYEGKLSTEDVMYNTITIVNY